MESRQRRLVCRTLRVVFEGYRHSALNKILASENVWFQGVRNHDDDTRESLRKVHWYLQRLAFDRGIPKFRAALGASRTQSGQSDPSLNLAGAVLVIPVTVVSDFPNACRVVSGRPITCRTFGLMTFTANGGGLLHQCLTAYFGPLGRTKNKN